MNTKRRTIVFCLLAIVLLLGIASPVLAISEVTIDIKPCKEPDVLNVNVIGWLPVGIYGNGEISPADVDPETVTLMGVPTGEWTMKEGYLLVKFEAAALMDAIYDAYGPVKNGEEVELTLAGSTYGGVDFVGYDSVEILKRGKR